VVLVGEDAASQVYVGAKGKACEAAGIASFEHRLPADTSEAALLSLVERLNQDAAVDGILVQLPLPGQLDEQAIIAAINPGKDVDGFHVINAGRLSVGQTGFVPCTPLGCIMLLKDRLGDLSGLDAVVIGRSNIVGKPMARLLTDANATVTIAHSRTKNLAEVVRRADDATTALPLYASAVEGQRSTKRKKKSDAQKAMIKDQTAYTKAVETLSQATQKKDLAKAKKALAEARDNLLEYRQLAQIDSEDGGVITLPLGNAEEAGHAGAPLGYVVPAFRGGGVSMDYALRPGEPMMKNGIINKEYRDKYQKDQK
jgi:hypothetical protein